MNDKEIIFDFWIEMEKEVKRITKGSKHLDEEWEYRIFMDCYTQHKKEMQKARQDEREKIFNNIIINLDATSFSSSSLGDDGIKLNCGHWGTVEIITSSNKNVCSNCFRNEFMKELKQEIAKQGESK